MLQNLVGSERSPLHERPQFDVDCHLESPSGLAVEHRSSRYHGAEHFFEAERLCTKLNLIGPMGLALAPLVLDWKWSPTSADFRQLDPAVVLAKLDDVRPSD
jgi:hypothetical protein